MGKVTFKLLCLLFGPGSWGVVETQIWQALVHPRRKPRNPRPRNLLKPWRTVWDTQTISGSFRLP